MDPKICLPSWPLSSLPIKYGTWSAYKCHTHSWTRSCGCMAGIYPMEETAFFLPAYDRSPAKIILQDHTLVRHSQDRYGWCCIVRIKLEIETNTHHILKSCTHLTKGTRLNTISQVYWMPHFYSATNGCFIFDLVIKHRVNCLFNSLCLDKTLLKLYQPKILSDEMQNRPKAI